MAQKSKLKVDPETVHERYELLAQRVNDAEADLLPAIPTKEPADLGALLRACIDDWEDARKSLRTVAVLNVFDTTVEDAVGTRSIDALVSLDATINVLDDIIDEQAPGREDKIRYTANVAFATTLLHSSIPAEGHQQATQELFSYFTKLFQTPNVESRLLEEMRATSDVEAQIDIATDIYRYRGSTIDGFINVAAVTLASQRGGPLAQTHRMRLTEDLRRHRARALLFKDVYDIKRDAHNGDWTPVLARLHETADPEAVASFIEQIASKFPYSSESRGSYRTDLRYLERRPDSLVATLTEQAELSQIL